MSRKIFKILITGLIFLLSVTAVFAADGDSEPVAEVNGVEITVFDVNREINMMYQQAIMQGVYPDDSQIAEYQESAVNTLIGRELLIQEAESKNYSADSAEVDAYINALTMNYGGTAQLEEALAAQGMALDKLESDAGRYQIVSSYVDNEVRSKIGLDASAARKYYDENIEYFKQEETVRASHILVQTSENAEKKELDEALAKIVDIREKIVGGESFESLAMEYSDCPSGANGGDLGEFGHGQMVPPFDRAVFALEPGELSQPLQT